jgi:hypothetical protein
MTFGSSMSLVCNQLGSMVSLNKAAALYGLIAAGNNLIIMNFNER